MIEEVAPRVVLLAMRTRMPTLRDLPPPARGRTGWPWTVEPPALQSSDDVTWPKITIVTPSYNQVQFAEATLRSVLLQGYPKVEYLVFDGGSTDGTAEVIARYGAWLDWSESERDRGQSHAINKGFERATGQIVAWLNTDDRYLPGTLHAVARQYLSHPGAAAWVGGSRQVDAKGRLIRVLEPNGLALPALADWGFEGRFAQPASFYRRQSVATAGPLDEALRCAFDFEFFLRLARVGEFVSLPRVLSEETFHDQAKRHALWSTSLAEMHVAQARHGFEAVAIRRLSSTLDALRTSGRITPRRLVSGLLRRLNPSRSRAVGGMEDGGE